MVYRESELVPFGMLQLSTFSLMQFDLNLRIWCSPIPWSFWSFRLWHEELRFSRLLCRTDRVRQFSAKTLFLPRVATCAHRLPLSHCFNFSFPHVEWQRLGCSAFRTCFIPWQWLAGSSPPGIAALAAGQHCGLRGGAGPCNVNFGSVLCDPARVTMWICILETTAFTSITSLCWRHDLHKSCLITPSTDPVQTQLVGCSMLPCVATVNMELCCAEFKAIPAWKCWFLSHACSATPPCLWSKLQCWRSCRATCLPCQGPNFYREVTRG